MNEEVQGIKLVVSRVTEYLDSVKAYWDESKGYLVSLGYVAVLLVVYLGVLTLSNVINSVPILRDVCDVVGLCFLLYWFLPANNRMLAIGKVIEFLQQVKGTK